MNLFVSEKEALANAQKTLDGLAPYHCPIYIFDEKGVPQQIGTSVLIDVFGHKFLVSAAHVYDETHNRDLCITFRNKFIPLRGDIIESNSNGNRGSDRIDLALLEVSEDFEAYLADYKAVSFDSIDYNHICSSLHDYMVVGFPASKNGLRYGTNSVKRKIYGYAGKMADAGVFDKMFISPMSHVIVNFRKNKLMSLDKNFVTFPDPYGISGGGIWLIENISFNRRLKIREPKLVAIGIEWKKHHKCLLGVGVATIIEMLKTHTNIIPIQGIVTNLICVS
ncbi:hypothetical protein [Thiothrix fructosivorans]|uniref:Peptidase S1 domain-containing protein n=1 Tax=Thiothrix fructosivorans TaxID=111770 RepID=A0A8B0SNX9_9GAMM|nr:hypothetical protein [Thiothrix fructosivorans]MBO0614151.1 hypothetical protein [Thiothrix fructosivorans]QTX12634.1 hypothetical protein J1836_010045 [Thiothrix fructosivorans]